MRVQLLLQGTTPLMMHNERLVDSQDEFTKQIKALTDKGTNQTESDKDLISKLEWYGGFYADEAGNAGLPTANIIRCLREAGTITRSGTKIGRGVVPYVLFVPLLLPGPVHRDKLWEKPEHRNKRAVGIGGRARVQRTRPIFSRWAIRLDFELLDDVLNFEEFVSVADKAGRAVGLGDGRKIGYGRFAATVSKAQALAAE